MASGIAAQRFGAFPRWLGVLSIVLAVLCLTPIGFFAVVAAVLWILGVSIWMFPWCRTSER